MKAIMFLGVAALGAALFAVLRGPLGVDGAILLGASIVGLAADRIASRG